MQQVNARAQSIALEYFFCAVGIYACFLTWGVLQERISTTPYPLAADKNSSDNATSKDVAYFRDFVFLNFSLSIAAAIVGIFYIHLKSWLPLLSFYLGFPFSHRRVHASANRSISPNRSKSENDPNTHLLNNPSLTTTSSGVRHRKTNDQQSATTASLMTSSSKTPPGSPISPVAISNSTRKDLWMRLLFISITSTLASPFGYASLRHVDYPTMLLAKSCKLLPVLVASVVIHRRRFPPAQYFAVALVSLGVSLFVFNNPSSGSSSKPATSASYAAQVSSPLGISLLICNLSLDGLTNASQDAIFRKHKITAFHMMVYQNLLAAALMFTYLMTPTMLLCSRFLPHGFLETVGIQFCPDGVSSFNANVNANMGLSIFSSFGFGHISSALTEAVKFVIERKSVLPDLLLFSLCGALGQIFIFHTLSRFGSLSLVTITVTRKMFSIILSVVVYKHVVVPMQWVAVALVFIGIILEAYSKPKKNTTQSQSISQSTKNLPHVAHAPVLQIPIDKLKSN